MYTFIKEKFLSIQLASVFVLFSVTADCLAVELLPWIAINLCWNLRHSRSSFPVHQRTYHFADLHCAKLPFCTRVRWCVPARPFSCVLFILRHYIVIYYRQCCLYCLCNCLLLCTVQVRIICFISFLVKYFVLKTLKNYL